MLRRRITAYEAPSLFGPKSSEPETPSKLDAKDSFLGLRIDMCDQQPSSSSSGAAVTRSKPHNNNNNNNMKNSSMSSKAALIRSSSVKAAYIEKAKAAAVVAAQPTALVSPSHLQSTLRYNNGSFVINSCTELYTFASLGYLTSPTLLIRRCQSASTIRKKLLNAVEQSSAQMTHEQLAALRTLAASAASKPTPQSLLSRQLASDGVSTVYTGGYRPSSAAVTSTNQLPPHHPQRNRSQDTFASSTSSFTSSLSRAKNLQHSNSSNNLDSAANPQHRSSVTIMTGKTVGGSKSSTVQLEVELAERLNEIERSKLNEKAASRFRACQKALDTVIQQDEQYGRILSRIRDEFNSYVDTVSKSSGSRGLLANQDCRCACGKTTSNSSTSGSNQGSGNLDFENALFRQENLSLKKNCAALQREIQVLQSSLMFATSHERDELATSPKQEETDELHSNELHSDEDLSEVQLLQDAECFQPSRRPPEIPPLNFATLSPYSEEADDDDDELNDEF